MLSCRQIQQHIFLLGCSFAFISQTSCGDLPSEDRIISTRLLATKISANSPIWDPLLPTSFGSRAEAIPLDNVVLEPFFVAPNGELPIIKPVWVACEMTSRERFGTCLRDRMPIALSGEMALQTCAYVLDPQQTLRSPEAIPLITEPCWVPTDGNQNASLQVPVSYNMVNGGEIEVTMIASTSPDIDTSKCVEIYLSGDHNFPETCIIGVQRVRIGPSSTITAILKSVGLAGIGGINKLAKQQAEPPQKANENLRLPPFEITQYRNEIIVFGPAPVMANEGFDVQLGDRLEVTVAVEKEQEQSFFVPVNNGQSWEEDQESIRASWYRDWGRRGARRGKGGPFSRSDHVPWDDTFIWEMTAEEKSEDQGLPPKPVQLHCVVRDNRGGVAWQSLTIKVAAKM